MLAAPLSNVTAYRVLRDNIGDSLKDITVWARAAQRVEHAGEGCGAGARCEALCLSDGERARCACPHGRLAPNGRNCTRQYMLTSTRARSHSHNMCHALSLFPAYDSFLMYSRVVEIDSIHLQDEKFLNSPYKPIENK